MTVFIVYDDFRGGDYGQFDESAIKSVWSTREAAEAAVVAAVESGADPGSTWMVEAWDVG